MTTNTPEHGDSRCGRQSPRPAAAPQLPPHIGQHVADLIEQLVRFAEHSIGFSAASRLPASLFPILDARDPAGDVGNAAPGSCWRPPTLVNSSALTALSRTPTTACVRCLQILTQATPAGDGGRVFEPQPGCVRSAHVAAALVRANLAPLTVRRRRGLEGTLRLAPRRTKRHRRFARWSAETGGNAGALGRRRWSRNFPARRQLIRHSPRAAVSPVRGGIGPMVWRPARADLVGDQCICQGMSAGCTHQGWGLSREVTTKSVRSVPQLEQRSRNSVSDTSPRPDSTIA